MKTKSVPNKGELRVESLGRVGQSKYHRTVDQE